MDEQTNSYSSQSMSIQPAVASEDSQIEDIADIDEVSRDLVDRLREDGYTVTFPMTINEARTKAGSPIFDILIENPKFLHDNKDLPLEIFDSISLVLQCILIARDNRAKQEKEVRAPFKITLKIDGKPITIETPDTKNASALCCLSNIDSVFPPHNFSSNCPRTACRADKHHASEDESCHVTFPRLYCPFSQEYDRILKTETGHFQTHIFSFEMGSPYFFGQDIR